MKIRPAHPTIAILGDEETASRIAKDIWVALPDSEVGIKICPTPPDLYAISSDCVIIFMIAGADRAALEGVLKHLNDDPDVVADFIAITDQHDLIRRMTIMSWGFDNIFNFEVLLAPDFRQVLKNKLRKGLLRVERRISQEAFTKFKATLSASPDAFIVFDENKRIVFASTHYLKVYPKTAPKLVPGLPVNDAFDMVADESGIGPGDPGFNAIRDFWYALEPGQTEFILKGGLKYLRISCTALDGGQGTIVSTTDITDYKIQEKALAEKSEALVAALEKEQEASNLQKQFIGMVSHEFRTPMAIIDGNAQLLMMAADKADPDTIRKRARTITSAVSRLVNMMESVLSSNLLKTGRLDPMWEDHNLKGLITELCREQADLSPAHAIDLDLQGLDHPVTTDPKLMTVILSNLISNAVKFSIDSPRIRITSRGQGESIVIAVADNGIGIPAEEIDRVFDRFFRTSLVADIPGSGVGLSLVRDLTAFLKGQVTVSSVPGQGSVFTLTLPKNPVLDVR